MRRARAARARAARAARASATTSASRSTPRKPTGSTSRSTSWRALAADPALAGLGRARLRRAGLPEARAAGDRLARRAGAAAPAAPDAAARQGRVLGHRDQARAGRRHAGLSGVHAQGAHRRRLSRVREGDARGAGRALSAVRDAQRVHDRGDPHARRRRALRIPVPARHGREHLRPGRRRRQARPRRAASTRRSARTRRCSPISCGGCSRTAPTSSFVNRIVDPAVSIASLVEDPVAQAERTGGAPHANLPLPGALLPGRRNSRGRRSRRRRGAARARARRSTRRRGREPARCSPRPRIARARGESTIAQSRRSATTSVGTSSRRRRTTWTARVAAAIDAGAQWSRTPAAERAACLERAADLLEAERATFLALAVREAGKTLANAVSRSARGGRLPALLRGRGARDCATPRPLGPIVAISPWNFPLAIFVGPGERRARRRQSRCSRSPPSRRR